MSASIPSPGAEHALRVLVVDDSAVAREVLTMVLRRDGFDVEVSSSGSAALHKILHRRPDVVLLDLEMPGMSGLEFLERLMRWMPMPVVVCSGIAQPGAAAAIRALELGAVEVIPKPTGGVRAILESDEVAIAQIVRGAASANTHRLGLRGDQPTLLVPMEKTAPAAAWWGGCAIVIGASTGGTEALRAILTQLPPDAPPVIVVQHMPGAFTGAFAQRLDSLCAIDVREAEDGDVLTRGLALIARGGRHIELQRQGSGMSVRVFDGPPISGHRPSVDALFQSAALACGRRAVGVLLTGMGADGAQGLLRMREQGAHTIAQNEATCVVFGMPGEAIAIGAAAEVTALQDIAPAILAAASFRADTTRNTNPTITARLLP